MLLELCTTPQPWVTIDTECVGWEGQIKAHLLNKLVSAGHWLTTDLIVFTQIGKASPAHSLAWRTFKGISPPTIVATRDDVLRALSGAAPHTNRGPDR